MMTQVPHLSRSCVLAAVHAGPRAKFQWAVVVVLMPIVAVFVPLSATYAQNEPPLIVSAAQSGSAAPEPTMPIYKPPSGKSPRVRFGGTTRGSVGQGPTVVALVPDHVAWTSHAQPTLYWYISQALSLPVIFTLREDQAVRPILETPLTAPTQPGIQLIRLKDFGINLKEKTVYRWFVSIQRDPASPSQDIVAGGMIELVDLVEILTLELSAEKGLWYDAMMILCEQIERSPEDRFLRQQRACLLDQAGLAEVGDLDRSLAQDGKRCPPASP